ncbi:MAG: 1-acyl-sn-glycerol-3-phosphate acyltransferase [Bacteroidota bacterium]|jgi:glycerol-3-phosphate O-acyltransferase/dihydroxyacetone phosphate acyltransferase
MNRFIYYFLRSIFHLTAQIFYRRVIILNEDKIPKNKPLLIAINHSNAFWDGVLVGMYVNRPVWFLARGDVFKKPSVAKILNIMGIAPVYRMQEGYANIGKNKETFTKCHQILSKNQAIALFPEGNCERESKLRPLKKGAARIAHGALETFGNHSDLYVTCAALNYDEPDNLNSEMLINFSQPIKVNDYLDASKALDAREAMQFTAAMEKGIDSVMFNIHDRHQHAFFHFVKRNFADLVTGKSKNEHSLFEKMKLFSEKINAAHPSTDACKHAVNAYRNELSKAGVREKYVQQFLIQGRFISTYLICLLLFIPSIPGLLFNSWPYYLSHRLAKKTVKKQEFFTSINLGAAGLLYFLWYLIIAIVFTFMLSLLKAFMLVMAIHFSGVICLHLATYFRAIKAHVKLSKLNHKHREHLLKTRENCVAAIKNYIAA